MDLIMNMDKWMINYVFKSSECKDNWIGRGAIGFPYTLLWRFWTAVTTIIRIVKNNTNDKLTSGASLALDEDLLTHVCLH